MGIRNKKGFSLQELLVAVLIIALMVVILITTGTHLHKQAQIKAAENTLAVLSTALEKYHLLHGDYPPIDISHSVGSRNRIVFEALMNEPQTADILGSIPDKFLRTYSNGIAVYDPWGQPYRYIYEDGYGTAIIESAGPDGQWGIDADDEKSFDNISY